jgi:stage II sporulation protein D
MKQAVAALWLVCAAARAEEIRIEVARGLPSARVEQEGRSQLVTPAQAPLAFDGPVRLSGRELPGKLELFAEGGKLTAVNTVDLEQYVAAVVASEVPPSWPAEMLKAQAVAARTFAVAQKIASGPGARAHLGASVLDQVYNNAAHPPASALQAAHDTAGQVLTWGAAPIAAYFSASCGGVSESAEAAFHLSPGATPYLRGGEKDGDERPWTAEIPFAEITAALRKAGRLRAEVRGISVKSRTASGRARTLSLDTSAGPRPLPAVELRQLLGYGKIPSLLFTATTRKGAAVFRGTGSGHGVGLCQWGAKGRALKGEGWQQILAHYYPGAELRRMY